MADKLRLLLVDDHELVSQGLTALLAPHYEVHGPIRDGHEVLAAVLQLKPDVLILDLSLPGRSGIDLLPEIHKRAPRVAVVVLTGHADWSLAKSALLLGASAFLPKDSGVEELEVAIRTVLQGRQYLSPRVPAPRVGGDGAALPPAWSALTPRQVEILRHMANGLSADETAEKLGVSAHTIHFHRRNLRRVLGIESEEGLIRFAALLQARTQS